MKNPFGDQQIPEPPGSYQNVKARVYKKVSAKVNDQMLVILQNALVILQNAYENALGAENVVLSRPERKRLFSQIVKMALEDVLKKLDDQSSSN